MGRKRDVTDDEKAEIIKKRDEGVPIPTIAQDLNRDQRTVKKILKKVNHRRKTRKSTGSKLVDKRLLNRIKREAIKQPLGTSKSVFEACGAKNISRTTRCRVMKSIAKVKKASIKPPLNKKHKEKRMNWAKKYLKTDFSKVIFTDECRATLDGPDGWARGWVAKGQPTPTRIRRQQSGGGVMFWAAILDKDLIGPFRVPDGVKINSVGYCEFLQKCFIPWWKRRAV